MIVYATVALIVLPLIVLRRRTLWSYYGVDAATWLLAWLVWLRVPEWVDGRAWLAGATVAVVKLATLALFLARGRDLRWSATRAALIAAILYGFTIPSMLRVPIDGDEPFYLLLTESMLHDADVDLANQYRAIEQTASGRTDIGPQFGDPTGADGEQYSRHEPFLPLLMVPGYAVGGLAGAVATLALFGVLLVRSTVRWMEDEGIDDRAIRAVFPFVAFGPPVLFYATRIWPEVPAAFFFVEAIRGMRAQRLQRWLPALAGLVMLKLRFILVAVGLVATMLVRRRRRVPRAVLAAAVVFALPLLIMWLASGSPTSVHTWSSFVPAAPPSAYFRGFFGLLLDGMSGIAFQAPFYLFGLVAVTRWRTAPEGFRVGMIASLLYVLYLVPRMEWFGGWAPPLRYVVFLMPVLALGAASVWDRIPRGAIAVVAVWTAGLVIHGVTYPWRLFHIANGENTLSEWLSSLYRADFSRLFPSFIRMNDAAWIAVVVLLVLLPITLRLRDGTALPIAAVALAIGAGFMYGRQSASHVEFEDAHVVRDGAELQPPFYTMMRVAHRGGLLLEAGDAISFLAREGVWTLEYISGLGALIEIGGRAYELPVGDRYQTVRVAISETGRVTIRCVRGAVNIDRMYR